MRRCRAREEAGVQGEFADVLEVGLDKVLTQFASRDMPACLLQ